MCRHVRAGGHGIAWDGPFSKELTRVVESAYAGGKVIGAVCHGPAGLIGAKITDPGDPLYGQSILTDKQVWPPTSTVLDHDVHQSHP